MPDLAQLLEKSEITFPRPLTLEGTISLFEFLALKLTAEVNYTRETHHRIDARGQEYTGKTSPNLVRSRWRIKTFWFNLHTGIQP